MIFSKKEDMTTTATPAQIFDNSEDALSNFDDMQHYEEIGVAHNSEHKKKRKKSRCKK
jgi:hypothetical protein